MSGKRVDLHPAERIKSEIVPKSDDRSGFQRDRDIILYTSAFKRLSGITQVVSAHTGHVFHNRLTHSLQVAQVGRSLVEKLRKRQGVLANSLNLDPQAVEAGCLAHDLGHPPFGHIAEETLNTMMGERAEGFEGNAQSFRIITELAFRSPDFNGLNLTRSTLRAVLKYPWTFANRPKGKDRKKIRKWGAYGTELAAFEHATGRPGGGPVDRAAEAELMDWADDLTYAIHDVEDFYRAGLIPLPQLKLPRNANESGKERDRFLNYVWSRKDKIHELDGVHQNDLGYILGDVLFAHFTIDGPYEGTQDQRARLRLFTSGLVNRYINALTLVRHRGIVRVDIDPNLRREVAILKQLTWCYVIEAPSLAIQQYAQKNMIRYLFGVFVQESSNNPCHLLPPYYRERLKAIPLSEPQHGVGVKRIVADLIAGMTEAQVTAIYQRLNGIVTGSAFEEILV
jgi:dGTPase